ncbi:hypothetical protein E8E11_004518 [Didymella keratinophila]|nr:hypothetical protein E8E11_004518 [Didymella keratinophila]
MKPTTILSLAAAATTTTATASNVHEVANLIARAIDPATMDPTKLSVLSVLQTAMPTPTGTETDIVLPTSDIAPQWYKDLPADVMVLLAQMYPATPTTADSTASVTASAAASQTTLSVTATGVGYSNGSVVVSTGLLSPNVTGITGGTTATASSTGDPTGKPGLELPGTSAGTRGAVPTEVLSAVIGLSVAAVFFLFA